MQDVTEVTLDGAMDGRTRHASRDYTVGEEIANSITHGVGVAFSLVALTLLVAWAVLYGDDWSLASAIAFGVSLLLLYAGSTLYHALPSPRARHIFKIIDHSAIYMLIAGSYTPFCLVTLRNVTVGPVENAGWWMFGIVWSLAAIGISTEAFWTYRPRWLSAVVYLAMGWLAVLMVGPLRDAASPTALGLLVAGGLCYTLGTGFYVYKRIPYFHMIWHLWVLAGSALHFFAVLLYVIPTSRVGG